MTAEMLGRLTFFMLLPFFVMLIVGGMYYLRVRPRLSFRQALFRWWVVLAGLVVLILALCGQIAQNV